MVIHLRRLFCPFVVLVLLTALAPSSAYDATTRVSISSAGEEGNGDSWGSEAFTNRFVAFLSNASNLVPGDTNGTTDVFVRDVLLGTTERVSVSSEGQQAMGPPMDLWEDYRAVAISADGRFIAFASDAWNLVPDDTNGVSDVFVRDRLLQITERVSINSLEQEGNGSSASDGEQGIAISADGRYVVFVSEASNLAAGDTNESEDVFVRDRDLGTTECVSVRLDNGLPAGECNGLPAISPDGRYVVFSSNKPDLVANDTNGFEDIFLRDRAMGITELISVSSSGGQTDNKSYDSWVSADGRCVVFDSYASNLVADDMNWSEDTFLRDRQEQVTRCVSVNMAGAPGMGGDPRISGDGRFVSFMSFAADLVPEDTNGAVDTFVCDLQADTILRVSLSTAGEQTGGAFGGVSADGSFICLNSPAADIVPGDTNGYWDVFVRRWAFPDVPPPFWAYQYIMACVNADIVSGYWDGTYRPELPVNRAAMAVFISRALAGGDSLVPTDPATATFPDVSTGYWAYKYVEYCYDNGIVTGYWDGYHPEEIVNRAQMAVYVSRAMAGGDGNVPDDPDGTPFFPDVPSGYWAYKYVEYCHDNGVVSGYWDGYHPEETVNRAQMAVYVQRAFALPM